MKSDFSTHSGGQIKKNRETVTETISGEIGINGLIRLSVLVPSKQTANDL